MAGSVCELQLCSLQAPGFDSDEHHQGQHEHVVVSSEKENLTLTAVSDQQLQQVATSLIGCKDPVELTATKAVFVTLRQAVNRQLCRPIRHEAAASPLASVGYAADW